MGMILLGIDTDQRCTILVQKKRGGMGGKWMVLKKLQLSFSVLHKMETFITFRKMVSSNGKLDAEHEGHVEEYLPCFVLSW